MQTPEPSNKPLTPAEKERDERARKKAEKSNQDTLAAEQFKNFRAPKGSESATEVFTAPKMEPGENVGAYSARVRKAREDFNKAKGQKTAIKVGNEKK